MKFEVSNTGYLIALILIGAVLGSAIGTFLVKIFPTISVIKSNLTGPIGFNLEVVSFALKLNLSSVIGVLISLLIYKKV